MIKRSLLITAFLILASVTAYGETVQTKYHGCVDLEGFDCRGNRSAFLHRICYHAESRRLLIKIRGTYYSYCDVPQHVIDAWHEAPSKGRYYHAHVKGQFHCKP